MLFVTLKIQKWSGATPIFNKIIKNCNRPPLQRRNNKPKDSWITK